jgi:transposase
MTQAGSSWGENVITHCVCVRARVCVRVCAWMMALGKILIKDNLMKRHIIIVDKCCLCKRNGESMDHILLHCVVTSAMWNALFTRFGLSWVMPRRVIDLFACWWKFDRLMNAAIWKMLSICTFWCVWKERNNRCFEDLESSMKNILVSFFHNLYL